jgi:hypothetical protein
MRCPPLAGGYGTAVSRQRFVRPSGSPSKLVPVGVSFNPGNGDSRGRGYDESVSQKWRSTGIAPDERSCGSDLWKKEVYEGGEEWIGRGS